MQRRVPGPAQELRHAQFDEPQSKLLGQRPDREPAGIAEAGTHSRRTLCDASRSNGRGDRLVELPHSWAATLDVELRQSDAILTKLSRRIEKASGVINAQLADTKFVSNTIPATSSNIN